MQGEKKVEHSGELWVWAERKAGKTANVSLELLGKGQELARELGARLAAVLLGHILNDAAHELIACGAEKVYLLDDPGLELYQSEVYARLLADLIQRHEPEIVLLGATTLGKDLAPRVAAKVGTGLTAHCIDLFIKKIEDVPLLVQVVPGWGGNVVLHIVCPQKRPQMATLRPGVLRRPAPEENRQGEIVRIPVEIAEPELRVRTVEMVVEKPAGVSLEEADIVVAGGWGLHSVGGIEPARKLAEALGGAVAGTRPAVDKGWVSEEQLIGQSGKTVSPRLFISLGASGAMHFTTGFLKSGVILAVDRNPQAPIFETCDVGIVGDLQEVLPCLLEEFQALLSSR
jgi:electron transfer flavoprotein alpha subunit